MSETTPDADHGEVAPVTDRVHDNSWSANLETPAHADDRDLTLEHARQAIEHTAPGNHVNLVTHGDQGHLGEFLSPALDDLPAVADYEYVKQCGCGGHITRVHVERP